MYTPTCRQLTKGTRHWWAKNGTRKADITECWADIFQHVSDMSSDTSMSRQNCQRWHPTNPTKTVSWYVLITRPSIVWTGPTTNSSHLHCLTIVSGSPIMTKIASIRVASFIKICHLECWRRSASSMYICAVRFFLFHQRQWCLCWFFRPQQGWLGCWDHVLPSQSCPNISHACWLGRIG